MKGVEVAWIMRAAAKELRKYIVNYCIAHSDMLEAQSNYARMRSTRTILQYTEAEAKFMSAQRALKARIPPFATMREVLGEFSLMLQESYLDTPDNE